MMSRPATSPILRFRGLVPGIYAIISSTNLGHKELAGLETFYRYAAELSLVPESRELRFY